ncbi:hypothetical protein BASA61_001462 [Batrachochytrium salamandrivorans]|nr:hypothetical protein BASA60_008032 [Batrachochytrium salamandrivorans]KAH6602093.1 hypothetical protein BASA61_001462 [Batrachochytrium salamandrivorans]KAH9266593.1 hypothetical protein BASA84_001081 [Batrachochytrium salamandrivorans]
MHFFYLLPFVVVASHAAALPQPAGLSEQYSNNVDAILASGLEVRSYQHALKTREDSPTLMSLERRADSAKPPIVKSGFSTPPLSTMDYYEVEKLIYSLFKKDDFSFANIASTIKKVGDGIAKLSENGEKAGTKIGGTAGGLLAKYLSRATYVNLVLRVSPASEGQAIISFIQSIETPKNSSKIFSDFFQTSTELKTTIIKKEIESDGFIVNILKDTGTVIENVEAAIKLLVDVIDTFVKLFDMIKTLMSKSESGKISHDGISNMMKILAEFIAEQERLHAEIMEKLRALPPK